MSRRRRPLSRLARAAAVALATAAVVAIFARPIAAAGRAAGFDDVLPRLVLGTRTALLHGAAATAIALALGVATGALAGGLGGPWDALVGRASEAAAVLPSVLVAALLGASAPAGSPVPVLGAVALVRFVAIARLVRALVLRALAEEWMVASRALGASPLHLAFRRALPHLAGPLLVATASSLGVAVLLETALAFLGLGAPDRATWGAMIADAVGPDPAPGAARGAALAALALAGVTGAAHLLAEAARERLDPRGEESVF